MILNKNLQRVLDLAKSYGEGSSNIIENFSDSRPNFLESFVLSDHNNRQVSIQSNGCFNGESGTWNTQMILDANNEISALRLVFEGEQSSRKAYADTYTLELHELDTKPQFWVKKQQLVNFTQSRVYNYRKLEAQGALTSSKVKELSTPVTISCFSLTAKKDALKGKYIFDAKEVIGMQAVSQTIKTELLEELEA